MKYNRKNRKINFIRTKNYIRKGGIMKAAIRITNELLSVCPELIEMEVESTERLLSKRYKLNLRCIGNIMGTQEDDFLHNCKHILMSFKIN